jgi:hypothetical protein
MDLACPIDACAGGPTSGEAGYGFMLRELAEIGLRAARRLDRVTEAVAEGDPDAMARAALLLGGKDLGAVLGRVSRGVRLTIMLAMRCDKDAKIERDAQAAEVRAEAAKAAERVRDEAEAAERKVEVCRIATAAIETAARERGDSFDREAKLAELKEMLDGEYDDIGDSCLTAGVEEVCQDLGVTPDRSLWDDDTPRYGPQFDAWIAKHRAAAARGDYDDDDWPP